MATQIQIKRGSTTPAGLTVGESAMNTSTNQIYLGGTGGTVLVGGEVTGGVDMGAGSAVSANRIPTQSGVYNYVRNSTVTSFNGITGAVTGVASIRGITGTVGITNGTGIGLSVSGQTMTFSNTGVLSIDGSTGAVANVARTNVDNNFSSAQTIDGPGAYLEIVGSSGNAFTLTPGTGIAVSDAYSSPQTLQFNQTGTTTTVTLPNYTTTLAGLSGNQTFTALNTFNAGISAAGGVTLAGTLQGTTASFTGLVSSAVGFSGAGTNLTNVAKLNTSNTFTSGSYLTVTGVGMFAGRTQVTGNSIIFTEGYDDGSTTLLGSPSTGSANTVTLPQTTGTVALTNTTVASFNGRTGAVQGVSAAVGSTYLTVSGSTGSVTFTNTGVQTFNGNTGAVTGVTVGGTNVFTALNTFNSGISAAGGTFSALTQFTAGLSGHINISETNATGNMYLLMARGTGVTAVFADTTTTPLVYQASAGNLGMKGITLANGNDRLYITPTQITATNTVTPLSSYFYFVSPTIYFQAGTTAYLTADGANRQLTWGDATYNTDNCYFGVNRADQGLCGDYAVEINHSTGKALQLIYNDYTGAASNWVNMDVSSGGNYTVRPSGGLATVTGTLNVSAGVCAAGATLSGLLTASAGISAAGGVTFSGNVTAQSTLYTDTILSIGNQINIANSASGRVAFGDYDGAGNSTFVFIRDATSSLLISNPNGLVGIGDPNNVGSGYALLYDAAVGSLDGNNSSLTNFSSGDFNGRLDMNGGYSERGATASQATNTITFNASSGNTQKFVPSAVINTVNFTNINTASTQCTSATLIFLHGATPYGLTTGTFSVQLAGVTKTVKWSGGSAPTLTNTANKTDILNFLTYDGGTTWLGFVGGLNF